jgi:anaerobic selenocysteine-containing dehydrogenase
LTGIDVVMTDSMKYCDVVLPAASHFEFDDIYTAYGHSYLQRAEPVVPTVGGSLPNTEIFRRLANAFGFDEPMFADDDVALMDAAIDPDDPRLGGHRPSELPTDKAFIMSAPSGQDVLMCHTVKPATPSGKVELFSEELERTYGFGTPRYDPAAKDRPFTVISPSSSKRTNATFGGDAASAGIEIVEMHPDDASDAGIEEGAMVRLENVRGAVTLEARLSTATRRGVLYTPKGAWLQTSQTGRTTNSLISADVKTDIVEGACYNETFVDISVA